MTEPLPQTLAPIQTQNLATDSPPASGSSTPASISKKRSRSPLSLDLASIPPLSQPAPPSNTLLITRLDDPKIFHPASLATIRQYLHDIAPLNSFSPLKSMSRIIVSFYDVESAIKARQAVDGSAILGDTVAKCYFGENTPIGDEKKYLNRPDAGRLFFISPPPSPPVGWEMRNEDPPNKEVHAEDLATQLNKLTGKMDVATSTTEEDSPVHEDSKAQIYTAEDLAKLRSGRPAALSGISEELSSSSSPTFTSPQKIRSRSSTLIYDPKAHGDSPGLPAVMLETEDDDDESEVELENPTKKVMAHTARPPVELMEE